MCGRFTLRARLNRVVQEMDLFGHLDWGPRYNIAPTQEVAIVRANPDGRRALAAVRWGLVPLWAKDAKPSGALINARAETIAEKPAFRSAFRKRRCLVLADGYYEWRAVGKMKQPYFIHRSDDAVFTFAGLWECRPGDDGTALETCTIVTTEANDLTRPLHDRMPVILDAADRDSWLASDTPPADLQSLMKSYLSASLVMDAVSTVVNNVRNDVPECVQPMSSSFPPDRP